MGARGVWTIPMLVLMLDGERRGEGEHRGYKLERNGRPGRTDAVQDEGWGWDVDKTALTGDKDLEDVAPRLRGAEGQTDRQTDIAQILEITVSDCSLRPCAGNVVPGAQYP